MRVVTLNVNGIRAAEAKGFFTWMAARDADVVCLQETRARVDQLQAPAFWPPGYCCYYVDAEKKGYSGVGLYTRKKPVQVIDTLGWPDFDGEGRYLEARFERMSVVSVYVPSGTSGPERQAAKYRFLERFKVVLRQGAASGRDYIFCGDWNIAHRKIDLKNWRGNQKHSGFLPEERAWMDALFGGGEYVDAFRVVNPAPEQYTWWSNRGRAWANNVGWRIDYQVVSAALKDRIRSVEIYKQQRFSDHAPLIIDYDASY